MPADLAMRIFESDLASHLKPTAAVFALFANEDGSSAYPSVPHVAWCVSLSVRRTRSHVTELVALGVLVPTTPRTGGRLSTRYDVQPHALPGRGSWEQYKAEHLPPTTPDPGCQQPGSRAASSRGDQAAVCGNPVHNPVENLWTAILEGGYGQHGCPAAGSLRSSLDPEEEKISTAAAPRFTTLATTPNGDNYHPILAIAHEVLETEGFTPDQFSDLVEAVKQRCADLSIDYGRHPDVAHNVVHRACAAALVSRLKTRCASAGLKSRHGDRRRGTG